MKPQIWGCGGGGGPCTLTPPNLASSTDTPDDPFLIDHVLLKFYDKIERNNVDFGSLLFPYIPYFGTLGLIIVDNLNVPTNATCTLNGTYIQGNLFVRRGATLYANAVRVDGNIQADQAAQVLVRPGSTVGGDIQVDTSGLLVVNSVRIDGNLQCQGNVPPPTGGNNTVGGNKEDQCANLQPGDTYTGGSVPLEWQYHLFLPSSWK
jgi:hypothetical protein